jgi:hypothetical protein
VRPISECWQYVRASPIAAANGRLLTKLKITIALAGPRLDLHGHHNMSRRRPSQPVYPFALPLLALLATGFLGLIFWLFVIGKDAFIYLVAFLIVLASTAAIFFAVIRLVVGIRGILRRLSK